TCTPWHRCCRPRRKTCTSGSWVTSGLLGRAFGGRFGGGTGARHDAHQPPVLGLGKRARLHDLDGIALLRLVVLVVGLAHGTALDVLAVTRVLDQAGHLDAPGLVHLVTGHNADPRASLRARRLVLFLWGGSLLGHFLSVPCVWLAALARSVMMVFIRATSFLALRISLGASRRSAADWHRNWNRCLIVSFRVSDSCSSLIARNSAGFMVNAPHPTTPAGGGLRAPGLLTSLAQFPDQPKLGCRPTNRQRNGIL